MSAEKIGTISITDNSAQVRFRYNTDCFKVISRVHGATYDKEKKHWIVPLVKMPDLLRMKTFSKEKFSYDFDEGGLANVLTSLEKRISDARDRALKNPFSVSSEDISLLDFDVVLDLASDARWIVHRPARSRKAKKLLKEIPYAFYTKKERGFLTSSYNIQEILKLYRDEGLSFAVAEKLSLALKSSAELRSEVQKGNSPGDAKALSKSLLSPSIDYVHEKGIFVLDGLNADIRARLKITQKKTGAVPLQQKEVPLVLYRGKLSQCPVFLTSNASEALAVEIRELEFEYSQSADNFRDELLAFLKLPLCWRVDAEGFGGLQISKLLWEREWSTHLKPLIKDHGLTVLMDKEGLFIKATPLRSAEFFDAAIKLFSEHGEVASVSRDFRKFLHLIRARGEKLTRQYEFQRLKDTELKLTNPENAKRLYPHQRVAVSWLLEYESGMLGDDMGLGKTLSVLTAFNELKDRGQHDLLLVICPNSLVKNWMREVSQWFPHLSSARLPDSKKERGQFLEALREQRIVSTDVFIINFESMRLEDVWPALKELCQTRKVYLAIDESQRMKNPQSKTFAALKEFAFYAQKRVLLSGTPTPKDITDIWAQMFILDKGERFGKSYYHWLAEVAELGTKWSEYAVKKFKPHAVEDSIARVHEVLLRRKKEDVISLPEKIFLFRDVEMTGDQKKRFEQLRDELRVQVRSASGKESVRVIESLLEQYLRAVQVASNPRLVDPTWKGEPAKFVELDDIVSDIVKDQGEKLVIWTNYLGNIHELTERYKEYGAKPFSGEVSTDERSATIASFQDAKDKKTRILVAVPAAGGVGITLTAAQTAVYIDRTWNAEHWLQSVDRIHRIGQTGTVRIIVLNASKIDELIGFNLKRKGESMEKLLSGQSGYESFLPTISELLASLE